MGRGRGRGRAETGVGGARRSTTDTIGPLPEQIACCRVRRWAANPKRKRPHPTASTEGSCLPAQGTLTHIRIYTHKDKHTRTHTLTHTHKHKHKHTHQTQHTHTHTQTCTDNQPQQPQQTKRSDCGNNSMGNNSMRTRLINSEPPKQQTEIHKRHCQTHYGPLDKIGDGLAL